MWMKKRIWSFFCSFFLITIITGQVVMASEPIPYRTVEDDTDTAVFAPAEDISLYATSAVLIDADSGRVLYGKNADTPMAMASTTKVMTCIRVLENCALDEVLTVSSYAASMPQVKLYFRFGLLFKFLQLNGI